MGIGILILNNQIPIANCKTTKGTQVLGHYDIENRSMVHENAGKKRQNVEDEIMIKNGKRRKERIL